MRKGFKFPEGFTEEHKRRIGLANIGKRKGTHLPPEQRLKISLANKGKKPWNTGIHPIQLSGDNHYRWADDKLTFNALHRRMRRNIPPPDRCPNCLRPVKLDLCNISKKYNPETYNLEPTNWYYSCRKCHQLSDGRLDRLPKNKKGFVFPESTIKKMREAAKHVKHNRDHKTGKFIRSC